jgi:hypothetical protein
VDLPPLRIRQTALLEQMEVLPKSDTSAIQIASYLPHQEWVGALARRLEDLEA